MSRLSLDTLASVPAVVARPAYDVRNIGIGIVHLGIGAFHRAQTAMFSDDALALDPGDWGICGVSMRSADVRDRLSPQGGLYTAVEKSPTGINRRIVGSVREVLFLGDQHKQIMTRLAAAETRIVSLTVTEKGYCHDPASGALNLLHPDIVHDLAHPEAPKSAVGVIAAALDARRGSHDGSLTVLCCDNLPHNGVLVRGLVMAFAEARDPALARWIETHASFPSTMVDRIVPATTEADIVDNDAAVRFPAAAPVGPEPFRQWAIEDRFVAGRPRWEQVGAELVDDVAPFETMKLRLLNGSHSAFAYLGFLAGHDYIYQVAAQPDFTAFMRRMMADEVVPTLNVPPSVDVAAYQQALVTRFANPALPHRTQQIAMDGSQKLPQRLLASGRENLSAGRGIDMLALAVAGWMRYVSGRDEAGGVIKVSDPLAQEFEHIAGESGIHRGGTVDAFARGLLGIRAIFGDDLPADERFAGRVIARLTSLFNAGAARTVAQAMHSAV